MSLSDLAELVLAQQSGMTPSELAAHLRESRANLDAQKVPNTKRKATQLISRGLRMSESLDKRLEALTRHAKATGGLEVFEKKNDLIRQLIEREFCLIFEPKQGGAMTVI